MVVIGSGATAMTIVPAMADDVEHITMLQRSPTYVVSRPDKDVIANTLRKFLPDKLAYRITRFKNVQLQRRDVPATRVAPDKVKQLPAPASVRKAPRPRLRRREALHPAYNPWDQRLCLIPNADLFEAINSGKASVVTDHIDRHHQEGHPAAVGRGARGRHHHRRHRPQPEVPRRRAVQRRRRARPRFPDTFTYKGMMYSDVPNLVQTFGYINASWTLRADLTAEYTCRLLNRMDELGMRQCTPRTA